MNFYEELFKSISNIDETDNITNDNVCLITNETLDDDHVKLECGHTFNYVPIYNEIYQQKYNKTSTEVQIVDRYSLKCPYCRNIQHGLLPPPQDKHGELGDTKFVNFPLHKCMKQHTCKYIFISGKNKGIQCSKPSFGDYCTRHIKYKNTQNKPTHDCQDKNVNTIINSKQSCCAILMSGKRKGQICGAKSKVFYNDKHYCGKHFKL